MRNGFEVPRVDIGSPLDKWGGAGTHLGYHSESPGPSRYHMGTTHILLRSFDVNFNMENCKHIHKQSLLKVHLFISWLD